MKTYWQGIGWTAAIAIVAVLFGLWTYHNFGNKTASSQEPILQVATVLPKPRDINQFHLVDDHHKPFTENNLKNHWSLVFFGFTHCPQICPTTLSVLNQVYQNLQAAHQQPMPQIIFISVDPERDTSAQIKQYLSSFNSNFVGATGNSKMLGEITKQFNVVFAKTSTTTSDYSVEHSGSILLINPQGQWYAVFSAPHDAGKIASDYAAIITKQGS